MLLSNFPNRYIFMIALLLGGVFTASPGSIAAMQEPELPAEPMTHMTAYFESQRSSRYMEQNCVATTYPGWEELPLKECTYSVKGAHDPVKKTAKVIMLNAEPDQLARRNRQ